MSLVPTRPTINPPTLLSTCCRSSKIPRETVSSVTARCAAGRLKRSRSFGVPESERPSQLDAAADRYLADLRLKNASPHTLRNYAADLRDFVGYFSPPDAEPPVPRAITALDLREWLGSLYERGLDPLSTRRKLAVVRS